MTPHDEQWYFMLLAGFLGGITNAYITKKDKIGYIISCVVGSFTSLFFGSSLALWSHDHFDLNIPISEYLSGCGFIVGMLAMVVCDWLIKTADHKLNQKYQTKQDNIKYNKSNKNKDTKNDT